MIAILWIVGNARVSLYAAQKQEELTWRNMDGQRGDFVQRGKTPQFP